MKQKKIPDTYNYIYKNVPAKVRFYTLLSLAEVEKYVYDYCNFKEYDIISQHKKNSISIIANQNRFHLKAKTTAKGVQVAIEMNDFDIFIQQFLPEKHKEYFNLQKNKWGFDLDQYKMNASFKEYLDIQKDDGYGCIVFPAFIACLLLLMLIWGLIFNSILGGMFILALLFTGLWYGHKMSQQVEMDILLKKLKALDEDSPFLANTESGTVRYLVEELGEGDTIEMDR